MRPGILYGIGVGPGDPELLPLKAVRILRSVDRVFAAASSKNDYSRAVEIVRSHIPPATPIEQMAFPMSKRQSEKEAAWEANAARIAAVLTSGRSAAFLTLGDPLIYSTYGYVLRRLKACRPDLPVCTVPGITSYQAAAAAINQPLVEGEESLLLTSGVFGGERFLNMAQCLENVVFLKVYRNVASIAHALETAGMSANSVAVANCSREDQQIYTDLQAMAGQSPCYWTLIIAKRNGHASQK